LGPKKAASTWFIPLRTPHLWEGALWRLKRNAKRSFNLSFGSVSRRPPNLAVDNGGASIGFFLESGSEPHSGGASLIKEGFPQPTERLLGLEFDESLTAQHWIDRGHSCEIEHFAHASLEPWFWL
jgi:hypothetical protein